MRSTGGRNGVNNIINPCRFWEAGVALINGSSPTLHLILDLSFLQFGKLCWESFTFYNISGTSLWKCTSLG